MKLLHHTARYQLLIALPMVVLGTAIGYVAVKNIVNEELDEQLTRHASVVQKRLAQGEEVPPNSAPDQSLRIDMGTMTTRTFTDTTIFDDEEGEAIPWRIGRFPVTRADGRTGVLSIGRATVEFDDLIEALVITIGTVLILLFFGVFLLNRWLTDRLWKPFHGTLDAMQQFQPDGSQLPALPPSPVDEFNAMNTALTAMMAKLRKDFSTQKRFTEQAAHELQTPLAVMQGKLDELIQTPELGPEQAALIEVLYGSRERMGRTVSNMLLLARVGNQEFAPAEVDWAAIVSEQVRALEGLISKYELRVELHTEHRCQIRLHPVLAELVAANLLRNAVQHNHPGGSVNVRIDESALVISNSGPALEVDPESLFARFAKGDPSSPGTGLGLSMVKEICDNAGLMLTYTEVPGLHTVVLRTSSRT